MQGIYNRAMYQWEPVPKVREPRDTALLEWGKPDLRADGSVKGMGWLGVLNNYLGQDVTEYSVGVNLGGKEKQIPTVTPNMNKYGMTNIMGASAGQNRLNPQVLDKAIEHARMRLIQGLSPYVEGREYKR